MPFFRVGITETDRRVRRGFALVEAASAQRSEEIAQEIDTEQDHVEWVEEVSTHYSIEVDLAEPCEPNSIERSFAIRDEPGVA